VSTCMITGWKPSSSFRRFERVIEGTDGSDQVGEAFWEQLLSEHGLDRNGVRFSHI